MPRLQSAAAVLCFALACGGETPTPSKVDEKSLPPPPDKPTFDESKEEAKAPKKKPNREELEALSHKFETELAKADKQIEAWIKTSEHNKGSLPLQKLAGAYMTRARLSGDYNDYKKAEEALDTAIKGQPKLAAPYRARARLNFTLHRMDRIAADLEIGNRQPPKPIERAGRMNFDGKVAFQLGDHKNAKRNFDGSLAIKKSYSNLASYAVYHWKTGQYDVAERMFESALKGYHGKTMEPEAWVHLQYGLMDLDRGRYDEALAHYRDAEKVLSGYWLIEEHIAEILTLTGKAEEAKKMYIAIIDRTNNPEFMDAMAELLAEEGKEEESKKFVARARKRYEELLALYPEAAYGHALEHYLTYGEDIDQIVQMAEKNHELRPNAEAKALLASAYLKAEQTKDAVKIIKEALKSPWKTADIHATAAEVFAAAGKKRDAKKQRELALKINPKMEFPEPEPPAEGGA